ncbi:MAG: heparan-alpha-glucosaminide N-acetyltransferase domain-containing protein [Verrucomicrobia bacterium]|nr:heparan-alpha-glucosaminide N-acetyltransferase domain-containing protein [Verrucomicrobiota bacterium]
MNPSPSSAAPIPVPSPARLDSVDLLRGLVMVVMALDHTRDYFHFSALQGVDPLDLTKTTAPIFLTRWLTHFCAPIFSFLAGTGVCLSVMRGKSKRDLSWFLVTRGLWLIFLELTLLMWFGWRFEITLTTYFFATLWSLGWSMIVLAGLIHCRPWVIAGFSLVVILGHNALDGVKPESWGAWAGLWKILHVQSMVSLGKFQFYTFYPLIPWVAVMAAGYSFGAVFRLDPDVRRKWLVRLGLGLCAAFVLLRLSNVYGNLTPWTAQPRAGFTLLSFLDCTKYPPSLCYLLMTLGPGVLLLAFFERGTPAWLKPALVFGRVPFFYYILHLPLIHALAYATHAFHSGDGSLSPFSEKVPPNAGVSLLWTYGVWAMVVVLLYPLCRWFAELKRRRRDAWLSYF